MSFRLRSIAAVVFSAVVTSFPAPAAAENLFEGVRPVSAEAGSLVYLANVRGRPVMKLTEQVRVSEEDRFKPMKPQMLAGGRTIQLRLVESTTQNTPMGVMIGTAIPCGEETCWHINYATDGVNADYGLMYLDRDVPLAAGETMHGCFSHPDTTVITANRPIWAQLGAGADGLLSRLVLKPIAGSPDQYQIRAVSVTPDANGVYQVLDPVMLNTGTPDLFNDETLTRAGYTCTWRMTTFSQMEATLAQLESFPESSELKDEVAEDIEDTSFQLFATNGSFCSAYKQFESNAGQCSTCMVNFADAGDAGYKITANNGWAGTVRKDGVAGQSTLAVGNGEWASNVGGAYAGVPFSLSFRQANGVLTMHMTSQLGTVVGKYHCAN